MLSRKVLILVFKLFRYFFSMRLCELWRLGQGDKSFSDRFRCFCFRERIVVVLVFTSGCSASHDEFEEELPGVEAKLGNFLMAGNSSSKGLSHDAVGVLALFSEAVGIIQGSMSRFWSTMSSTPLSEEESDIGDGSANTGGLEEFSSLK
jgi:hypothetical protein